jgi:hypothetical protein
MSSAPSTRSCRIIRALAGGSLCSPIWDWAYYHYGYFSKAIDAWEQAWLAGREVTELRARALVDRAVGELVRMHARLGHAERLASLLEETNGRHVTGPATEALAGGKEGLWMMQHNPGVAYLCGPMALKSLLLSQGAAPEQLHSSTRIARGRTG